MENYQIWNKSYLFLKPKFSTMITKYYYLFGQLTLLLFFPIAFYAQSVDAYETSFLLKYNLVVLQASVNGETGFFILDTGIPDLVLNAGEEKPKKRIKLYTSEGNQLQGNTRIVQLSIGPWNWKSKFATLVDLSEIEQKMKIPIMGLIGINCLKHFEIYLNYQSTTIRFIKLDKKGNKKVDAYQDRPIDTIPFHYIDHLPYVKTTLNGQGYFLVIDTGAAFNIFSERKKTIVSNPTFTRASKIIGIKKGSNSQKRTFCRVAFQIGHSATLPMLTVFKDLRAFNNNLMGKKIDGLLGFEFLSQQEIAINFKQKKLYLWPRKSFRKKFGSQVNAFTY